MKLYHYVTKPNNVLTEGLLSFAKNDNADISYYIKRSGQNTKEGVVNWMENCFEGRSRGVRGFSEPIQYTKKSVKMFKNFIEGSDLFEIDLTSLEEAGLIEAIYISPAMIINDGNKIQYGIDEVLEKLDSINRIGSFVVDWHKCDDKKGLRFSVIPYYIIVVKEGIIPVKYINKI
ncbi:MAG: hypothetical protein R3Y43_05115 [Alphaproteobacteria bacterium]